MIGDADAAVEDDDSILDNAELIPVELLELLTDSTVSVGVIILIMVGGTVVRRFGGVIPINVIITIKKHATTIAIKQVIVR